MKACVYCFILFLNSCKLSELRESYGEKPQPGDPSRYCIQKRERIPVLWAIKEEGTIPVL